MSSGDNSNPPSTTNRAALSARLARLSISVDQRPALGRVSSSSGEPRPPRSSTAVAPVQLPPRSPDGSEHTAAATGAEPASLPRNPSVSVPVASRQPVIAVPRTLAGASHPNNTTSAADMVRPRRSAAADVWGGSSAGTGWVKWIVLAVILAGAGLASFAARDKIAEFLERVPTGSSDSAPEGGVRTLVVTEQAGGGPPPVLLAGGKIVSDRKVFVSTKVSGQITAMLVEQGDRVVAPQDCKPGEKPTVIARIETDNYDARLRQTEAELLRTQRDVERVECAKGIAEKDIPRLEAARARAVAEVARARAEVRKAELDVARAQAEIVGGKADVARFEVLFRNAAEKFRDTEYFARQKASTDFELRDARAGSESAAAQLDSSRAQLSTLQRKLDWAAASVESAKAALAAAEAAVLSADADLASARETVTKAEHEISIAKAAVKAAEAVRDLEKKRVTDCEVLAPISGVVLERSANVGDYVTEGGGRGGVANSQFVTLADTDLLRVEVDITESDISRLRPKMPCVITPDAFKDRRYPGTILWIDPISNYSKATVQVKVRIEKSRQDDPFLRVEGAAKVEFHAQKPTESGQPSIYVATSAVSAPEGAAEGQVQTLDGEGRVRTVKVQLGKRVAGQVEIKSGLRSGQSLVAEFSPNFREGQLVKPPK